MRYEKDVRQKKEKEEEINMNLRQERMMTSFLFRRWAGMQMMSSYLMITVCTTAAGTCGY